MKPWLFCLAISLSLAVLVVAILLKGPKPKTKEGFQIDNQVNMGLLIGAGVLMVIFGGFFLFFYSFPKKPNVVVRIPAYFNME